MREKEEVNTTEFRSVFMMEPFSLTPGAVAQLVSQCDSGDFGVVSLNSKIIVRVRSLKTFPTNWQFCLSLLSLQTPRGFITQQTNGSVCVRRAGNGKIDYTFQQNWFKDV